MGIENKYGNRGFVKSVDWSLILVYLVLVLIGWINIYASVHSSEPSSIFDWECRSGKQFVWILTSLGIAGIILFVINPRIYEGIALPVYIGVLALLVGVIFLGIEVKGSRSWFEFGPVRFQPAEISKISTSLLLAMVMSRNGFRIGRIKDFLLTAFVILLPMLIIVLQSETGSALVYVGFIFALYREGLPGWWLVALGMAILIFILTLTSGAYVSILVLAAFVAFCVCVNSSEMKKWLSIYLPLTIFLAVLPWGWSKLSEVMILSSVEVPVLVPEEILSGESTESMAIFGDAIAMQKAKAETKAAAAAAKKGAVEPVDEEEEEVNLEDLESKWKWMLRFKPIYLLLLGILCWLPVLAVKAFKTRSVFRYVAIASVVGGILLVFSADFVFNEVLQDHQRKRIEVLLGMKEDRMGVGYNVNQSKIAIGSGGLFGKGFLQGTQTTYGFVPEQSTDFIFCTIGEEWGFMGSLAVICLYVFLIWRIVRNAERSRQSFTRIYGYCVACCIFMHLFINIGMTIGVMPVIGIPLPFVSYGGSSLWAFTTMLFIFIALDRNEKKYF